jgi:hypothetical protein
MNFPIFALILTLSLRREREDIFKAIPPCPHLLKRGGISMSRAVFDPTLQPFYLSERLAKERKGSSPFLEGRESEGRRF